MIYNADSIEKLKELDENSVDSIVTDPPYFINFMNKKWDAKKHIAAHPDFWTECLRVLKPGGHVLAFGHSRTHHRLFTAIEDAGFQIKDTIMWLYGSGFPKSHNISKGLDKRVGAVREVIGTKRGVGGENMNDIVRGVKIRTHEDVGGKGVGAYGTGAKQVAIDVDITAPATDEAKQWEGWGTALKPAHEPICLAQKPREGTYADNVLKHGVGGINIDASRVGSNEDFSHVKPRTHMKNTGSVIKSEKEGKKHSHADAESLIEAKDKLQNLGRFPANIILSHSDDCKQVGVIEEKVAKNIDFKDTKQTDDGFWEMNKCVVEKQTVVTPDYECADGCPIKELDEQSGTVKTGTWNHTAGARPFNNDGTKTNYKTHKVVKEKAGGASRFFKQVDTYECVDGCPIKELDEQSGTSKSSPNILKEKYKDNAVGENTGFSRGNDSYYTDKGGASRFFYCAKSGKKERNKYMPEDAPLKSAETRTPTGAGVYAEKGFNPPRRNHHPTIKPLKLMTYLIKLVTPAGGTVLDPFMGSGSTGIAAIEGGWDFIGIEKDPEYYFIAKARLDACVKAKENK